MSSESPPLPICTCLPRAGEFGRWDRSAIHTLVSFLLARCEVDGNCANVSFGGGMFDRWAADDPELLAAVREHIKDEAFELVGGTYGQPVLSILGGEACLRQLAHGVRAMLRHTGARPLVFAERAAQPFPQLPQVLRGCGFEAFGFDASRAKDLEPGGRVRWRGLDGTEIDAVAVEFDDLSSDHVSGSATRDTPALSKLLASGATDAAAITSLAATPLSSLGKNADRHTRLSRRAELALTTAESVGVLESACTGAAYPHWELQEAWRDLSIGQYDGHLTFEGRSGAIGRHSFERSLSLACEVVDRALGRLAPRVARDGLVVNPFGWPLEVSGYDEDTGETLVLGPVPAFGYIAAQDARAIRTLPEIELFDEDDELTVARGDTQVIVDPARGVVSQILTRTAGRGVLDPHHPLLDFRVVIDGRESRLDRAEVEVQEDDGFVSIRRFGKKTGFVVITLGLAPLTDAVDLSIDLSGLKRPDPGVESSLRLLIAPNFTTSEVRVDSPFGVAASEGELVTSHSYFELRDPDGQSVQVIHDGSPLARRTPDGLEIVLCAYDEDDDERFAIEPALPPRLRLVPRIAPANHELYRAAREFEDPSDSTLPFIEVALAERTRPMPPGGQPDLPGQSGFFALDGDASVIATSVRRAMTRDGRGFDRWVGRAAATRAPLMIRLVETDGVAAKATIRLAGLARSAARTDLMGELPGEDEWLEVRDARPPRWASEETVWTEFDVEFAPYEIVSIAVDIDIDSATAPLSGE